MFAQRLSGRRNTLSIARPGRCCACVPPPPPPSLRCLFVDAHLSVILVRWMEKRVILLLRWPSEQRRPPPVFNGPASRFPEEILGAGQTQHFNYYHKPPSAWAVLHRLTQIEDMLEEHRERPKKQNKRKSSSRSLWLLS